jgi:hypothetical protein
MSNGEQSQSDKNRGVIDTTRFATAPCYLCGYSGAGYFQPKTHPCAVEYHRINDLMEALRDPLIAAERVFKLERELAEMTEERDTFAGQLADREYDAELAPPSAERPSVPNPCSICGVPIVGSFIGTGDGTMKDGGSFAHPECYWQRMAEQERDAWPTKADYLALCEADGNIRSAWVFLRRHIGNDVIPGSTFEALIRDMDAACEWSAPAPAHLSSKPARDPDTGQLREDLEAVADRVYGRLFDALKKRGIALPGCDATDKALEIIERWALEEASASHERQSEYTRLRALIEKRIAGLGASSTDPGNGRQVRQDAALVASELSDTLAAFDAGEPATSSAKLTSEGDRNG